MLKCSSSILVVQIPLVFKCHSLIQTLPVFQVCQCYRVLFVLCSVILLYSTTGTSNQIEINILLQKISKQSTFFSVLIGNTGALNGVLEISCSQNYENHTVRLSKNLGKILKYTLKIPTNEFNFTNAAGENVNFYVGFLNGEKL